MKNIFVVGFARSGTTLLQTYVSALSSVISFPETSFFFYHYMCPLDRLPVSPMVADAISMPRRFFVDKDALSTLVKEIGLPNVRLESHMFHTKKFDKYFILSLDSIAEQRGKAAWVEKSTVHLRRIPRIVAVSPNAKFIHVIRRFPAVLDSWERVGREHPNWTYNYTSKRIFRNWVRDLKRTEYWVVHRPDNHIGFTYEELCNDPKRVIGTISRFCELPLEQDLLENRKRIQIDLGLEPWKANVFNEIRPLKEIDQAGYPDHRGESEYRTVEKCLERSWSELAQA